MAEDRAPQYNALTYLGKAKQGLSPIDEDQTCTSFWVMNLQSPAVRL